MKKYRGTNWKDYGVVDPSPLEKKEDDFYKNFEKICDETRKELKKKIEAKKRIEISNKIIKNIIEKNKNAK